jgi:hypothetical protein
MISHQQRLLRGSQLGAVIAMWKEVAINIERHHDRGVAEPRLHDLGR